MTNKKDKLFINDESSSLHCLHKDLISYPELGGENSPDKGLVLQQNSEKNFHKAVLEGGVKTSISSFQISKNFIKKWEGLKLQAYQCSANVWTIGYGHTKTAKAGMKITEEKAEELLEADIQEFYFCVLRNVGKVCNQNQIASLTSFTFNVGISSFEKSKLLKVIKANQNNFSEIEKQFMRWVYANKTVIRGLWNRRKAEFELYKTSDGYQG